MSHKKQATTTKNNAILNMEVWPEFLILSLGLQVLKRQKFLVGFIIVPVSPHETNTQKKQTNLSTHFLIQI